MAEKDIEKNEEAKKLAALQAELEKAKAENKKLSAALDNSNAPKIIKGTFEYKSKTFGFIDGHENLRIPGLGIIPTESVIKVANSKKLTAAELTENEFLSKLTEKMAINFLHNLVQIGYAYLRKVV